jgi:hypothetical protein
MGGLGWRGGDANRCGLSCPDKRRGFASCYGRRAKGWIFWRIASGAVFAVVDGEKSKLRNFSRYSSFYTSSITVNWQKTWSEVCRELRNYLETSWGS